MERYNTDALLIAALIRICGRLRDAYPGGPGDSSAISSAIVASESAAEETDIRAEYRGQSRYGNTDQLMHSKLIKLS